MAPTSTHPRRRAHTMPIEKWDVAVWNDQVNSEINIGLPCAPSTRFATTASAFGIGAGRGSVPAARKPRPLPDSDARSAALAALHRSVEEHDAGILARMRELEERCNLVPDSLALPPDSGASRGRKRAVGSWDDDGDIEMACWHERRRRRSSPRGSLRPGDDEHASSDDGSIDSDDDLDIVIVPGESSPPSLLASTPPSLSTSLASLASDIQLDSRNYTPLHPKGVDDLVAALAGGAGSVVEWSTDMSDSPYINPDITQAGALWS